jgi:hypothetical protein
VPAGTSRIAAAVLLISSRSLATFCMLVAAVADELPTALVVRRAIDSYRWIAEPLIARTARMQIEDVEQAQKPTRLPYSCHAHSGCRASARRPPAASAPSAASAVSDPTPRH